MNISSKILSDIIIYMKYAKYIPELKRRETWDEIVTRNMEMHIRKFPQLEDRIRKHYQFVYDKKVLPSMRSMQFAGKPIEISPSRIYNCSYLPIDDYRAFSEIMHLLLSGVGCGLSVQKHHVEQLPEIRKPNPNRHKRFLIGDSIEGWADAIKTLMKSYFNVNGTSSIIFDYSDIRPKGARLITSGGKAPGPQPLKDCIYNITKILDQKQDGEKLSPLEVHDIICFIADAVLSGGIRRAALISFFSMSDNEMLACKAGNWWEQNPQRGRANNSVVILRHRIEEEEFNKLWERIRLSGCGEPGIMFTNDKEVLGNPCLAGDTKVTTEIGEISIEELVSWYEQEKELPKVLSYNKQTKELEFCEMSWGALTREQADVIELEFEDGENITLTPDHEVYTKNRGYVKACNLTEDDEIISIK